MARRSPEEADFDRISDELFRRNGNAIQDRDSFDLAFNDYFNEIESGLDNARKDLRRKTFREYLRKHPDTSPERLFTEAGGKSLRKDRESTAKNVVSDEDEFVRRGARNVDLKDFDTKMEQQIRTIKKERIFNLSGRVKNKVVFVRQDSITNRGKNFVVFRDKKGRFASRRIT